MIGRPEKGRFWQSTLSACGAEAVSPALMGINVPPAPDQY
jgi:hypothetical protein